MPDLKSEISSQIYKACEKLGATPELLSIIGSYGDTLSDADVLAFLKTYNAGKPIMSEVICSTEKPPGEVIDFEARKLRPYLDRAVDGFLNDPPDSDFQRGFLAALIVVYREGLGQGAQDSRLEKLDRLITKEDA